MFDIFLSIVLCVLAVRAFRGLRRESSVRREFNQSSVLEALVLLYPLAPLGLFIGPRFLPVPVVLVLAAAPFAAALVVASRQRNALERSGTDRVNLALEATSSATGGAMLGIIYVAVVAIFVLLVHALSGQPPGV